MRLYQAAWTGGLVWQEARVYPFDKAQGKQVNMGLRAGGPRVLLRPAGYEGQVALRAMQDNRCAWPAGVGLSNPVFDSAGIGCYIACNRPRGGLWASTNPRNGPNKCARW